MRILQTAECQGENPCRWPSSQDRAAAIEYVGLPAGFSGKGRREEEEKDREQGMVGRRIREGGERSLANNTSRRC